MYYLYYWHDSGNLVSDIKIVNYMPEKYALAFTSKEEAELVRSKELTRLAAEYLAASHRLLERKN